jgi:hypothetical protein
VLSPGGASDQFGPITLTFQAGSGSNSTTTTAPPA